MTKTTQSYSTFKIDDEIRMNGIDYIVILVNVGKCGLITYTLETL